MTPQQTRLVRESFALVQPIATQAAALFYDKLFERDPTLMPMFRGDMAQQGARLMQMIEAAVALLGRPAQLDETLMRLGERHVGYGVMAAHYPTVGAALLDTLAAGLGDDFTAETREAWAALYSHVAETMLRGAMHAGAMAEA